ncbi:hypothetical protein [Deinococcus pimensis]|uniref:hypothetical protein n=1 Tax=Deinococcus pimensis TaxID=309888 RepID=UPI00047F039F|nr:hypothetical protein [Deinococcus pimensis]
MTEAELRKLKHETLRRFVRDAPGGEVSVIVELDVPAPKVVMRPPAGAADGRLRPRVVAADVDAEVVRRQVEEPRAFLEARSTERPRFLEAAASFVVTVTVAQLAEVARFPHIKAVFPNRPLGQR